MDAWPAATTSPRRLVVQVVLLEDVGVGRLLLGRDRRVVGGGALLTQEAADARRLLLGDVGPVHAHETRRGGRQIQHVAAAEELLGPVAVENRARVDLRRHAERDARWQVGLDQAGDHVDRRALGGQDEVDADGPRHLREAGDRLLHLAAREHHQVGQLVDGEHDVGQRLRQLVGIRGRLAGPAVRLLQLCAHVPVVLLQVAHPFRRQLLVAFLHLVDGPAQGVGGQLRLDHHRRQQVGDVLVHAELEPLGIDQDEPHVVGRGLVEDAREHRVHRHALARAGGAGDEEMGHLREVSARGSP